VDTEIDLQKERKAYFARGYSEGWDACESRARKHIALIMMLSLIVGIGIARGAELGMRLWGHP
jgi:hypothetical protein